MSLPSGMQVFVFNGFSLDQRQRLLFGPDGRPVPLTGRAFDTLQYFLEHPNVLIEKAALMKAVWPNVIVEDNNLNQSVSLVRRALGETPGQHRFIVTVPGRGFRFVPTVTRTDAVPESRPAPVPEPQPAPTPQSNPELTPSGPPALEVLGTDGSVAVAVATGAHGWRSQKGLRISIVCLVAALLLAAYVIARYPLTSSLDALPATAGVHGPSIAVLPFANLSGAQDQDYFSDGLTEELSAQLAQLPGLQVIGRTSAFAFKGKNEDLRSVGKALGVDHLLEGTVRKEGNQLRITAALVDVHSGAQLWSQIYDRKLDDVFAIQKDIGRVVATELRGPLGIPAQGQTRAGTSNVAAYDAYLAGVAALRQSDPHRVLEDLERAVALDPMFVRAWSALADAYAAQPGDDRVSAAEYQSKARAALAHALELAPDDSELLYTAALMSMGQARDWVAIERWATANLKRSGSLDFGANMLLGSIVFGLGRPQDAERYYQAAERAEPLILTPHLMRLEAHLAAGAWRDADVTAVREKVFSGDPTANRTSIDGVVLGRVLQQRDQGLIQKLFDQHSAPADPFRELFTQVSDRSAAIAELRRMMQDPALQARPRQMYTLAQLAAYFGDPELSLRALRSQARVGNLFVLWRPGLKEVRRLPGFKALVRELGLYDYWRASGQWGAFCHRVGRDDFECS